MAQVLDPPCKTATVRATAIPGLPEISPSMDLATEIEMALSDASIGLTDGDILVIASKVVAKAEGRTVPEDQREVAVARETLHVVAERELPDGRAARVVRSRSGPTLANAGVDLSDVVPGSALLLPEDPDASARELRQRLSERMGARPAVVITDTSGRPWREGVVDFALGAAGLTCLEDLRGHQDRFGRNLEVTIRGIADEVAALSDLVRGKGTGCPVAVVQGLAQYVTVDDGPGASAILRGAKEDWFFVGPVEAVRASLSTGVDAPLLPVGHARQPHGQRLQRVIDVASANRSEEEVRMTSEGTWIQVVGDGVRVGMAVQRLLALLWTEGLQGRLERLDSADAEAAVVVIRTDPAS